SNVPPRESANNRVSIPIDVSTGKIDRGSMRTSTEARTKEALKKSLDDPDFRKWIGITAEEAKPQIITTQAMAGLLDVIARVEASVYSKKAGLEFDEVYKLVEWDSNEHRILDGQAASLANKYIPLTWLTYADVGVFAMTVFAMMKMKAQIVENYAKQKFNRIVQPEVKPAPANQPEPVKASAPVTVSTESVPDPTMSRSLDFPVDASAPSNGENPLKGLEG